MIIRCPNCGAALTYDSVVGQMSCEHCCSFFDLKQFHVSERDVLDEVVTEEEEMYDLSDTFECEIYRCTSCGARLIMNQVETATFCAYCNQPTICYERVGRQKRPDKIMPFLISKEQARNIVRERLAEASFVPLKLKKARVEQIRGIYIPYSIFDLLYEAKDIYLATVSDGKGGENIRYFYREGGSEYRNLTVDSSVQLNDNSSRRLEPYYVKDLRDFDPGYLSGYYADIADEDNISLKHIARVRAKELYDGQMKRTIRDQSVELVRSKPHVEFRKEQTALLPAWFFVYYYEGKRYTIMVNGQTGKVVGAVPMDKKKLIFMSAVIVLTSCTVCMGIASQLPLIPIEAIICCMVLCIGISAYVIRAIREKYKIGIALTTAEGLHDFTVDRSDRR